MRAGLAAEDAELMLQGNGLDLPVIQLISGTQIVFGLFIVNLHSHGRRVRVRPIAISHRNDSGFSTGT